MELKVSEIVNQELLKKLRFEYFADNGDLMTCGNCIFRQTALRGQWIKGVFLAGAGTAPQYRHHGNLFQMVSDIENKALSDGVYVMFMHPFSFECYRPLGVECVSNTVICTFPTSKLNFTARYTDLVPIGEAQLSDLLQVYHQFAIERNLSWKRNALAQFLRCPGWIGYLYYNPDNGVPEGYVVLEEKFHYDGINRNVSDGLHIWEMGFVNAVALKRLLGFLRVYEGQLDTVYMHDVGMSPEIFYNLHHYMHTQCTVHPDVAVKILDFAAFMEQLQWPLDCEGFSMAIVDPYGADNVRNFANAERLFGHWRVEFSGGKAEVTKMSSELAVDLTVSPQSLARLMYGCDGYTSSTLAYLPGVEIHGDVKAVLRTFAPCRNGLFEHF